MMTALRYCRCNNFGRCFMWPWATVGRRSSAVSIRQGPKIISNVVNTVLLLRGYLRRRRNSYYL